jgi:catechol 2,3-dioxygenase-like lactoylglutathione lyase family enzyme
MSSSTAVQGEAAATQPGVGPVDLKLEVVTLPVADVERAQEFYEGLGWRVDADFTSGSEHVLQFTPPGSACSIHVGTSLTTAAPGSAQGLLLIVSDIQAARAQLLARGVDVSEVFHLGSFNRIDQSVRLSGPSTERPSYGSFASFSDPDGNGWLLQQVTTRLPGRVAGDTSYGSVNDLAQALRRAEAAHGEHEKKLGQRDADWPSWYASYMIAEQAGTELPT